MPNRLAAEKSPYLLQHASNPVDWYPWSDEAFEVARATDRPVFLSIGYATCHWCHVMERESFEDPVLAAVLNRDFVAVKVDREERPDVDRLYMLFVQAATGAGGWPMSVFLTPDRRPFYGGTYFPPARGLGRPGFGDLLAEIARAWRDQRQEVEHSATLMIERLSALNRGAAGRSVPGASRLDAAVRQYEAAFDARHGGFGGAPKFPRPAELLFLLSEHRRTLDDAPRDIALATLRAMADGGIRDHLGGGFHRYAVDAAWRVPHFEKMLYDQAQIALAFLEAARLTGERALMDVARDTLDYVRCDMTAGGGGFYSAEDADSLPPGEPAGGRKAEGAYYVWTDEAIAALTGPDAPAFRLRYGIEPGGNAPVDPHGEFAGANLLFVARPIEAVAEAIGGSVAETARRVEQARGALFHARKRRPRPALDDKVITAWNGLMIAAFARAARLVTDLVPGAAGVAMRDRFLDSARRAAQFLRRHSWQPDGPGLMRRHRDGETAIPAFAEDYASLVFGLLDLAEADSDPAWLEWAADLQARFDRRFWDDGGGGWFATDGGDPGLLLRLKEDYDGAEPCASSLGACNLLALARLTGDQRDLGRLDRVFEAFSRRLEEAPRAMPMMLLAISTRLAADGR